MPLQLASRGVIRLVRARFELEIARPHRETTDGAQVRRKEKLARRRVQGTRARGRASAPKLPA